MNLAKLFEAMEVKKSRVATDEGKEYIVRQRGYTMYDAAQELAQKVSGQVVHFNPNYAAVCAEVEGKRAEFYINMK